MSVFKFENIEALQTFVAGHEDEKTKIRWFFSCKEPKRTSWRDELDNCSILSTSKVLGDAPNKDGYVWAVIGADDVAYCTSKTQENRSDLKYYIARLWDDNEQLRKKIVFLEDEITRLKAEKEPDLIITEEAANKLPAIVGAIVGAIRGN